jgi:hypothetical protein
VAHLKLQQAAHSTPKKELKKYSDITSQVTNNFIRSTLSFPKTASQSYKNIKISSLHFNLLRKVRVYRESLPESLLKFRSFKRLLKTVQSIVFSVLRLSLSQPANWCIKIRHPKIASSYQNRQKNW